MKELRTQPQRNDPRTQDEGGPAKVEDDDVLEVARLASVSLLLSGYWFCL